MPTIALNATQVFAPRAVRPVFTATLFVSAGLMFLIEPMIAKMLLPRLGGSPAVWSTCLVFFQATLLLGYAYAHVLTHLLTRRTQVLVHGAIVLPLAALSLPLHLGASAPVGGEWPAVWLLIQLVVVLGPTVFAISATAPLLQSWFGDFDQKAVGEPYLLYGASNAGSLLALLAYPLVVEPYLPLDQQASLWSWGFGALILCIALSAGALAFQGRVSETISARSANSSSSLTERFTWMTLAFVPSSLLLGATTHITTDLASAPLLWVVPLALYLLSFILVFAQRPLLAQTTMTRVMPLLVIPVALTTTAPNLVLPLPILLSLHFGCLFVACMVCHGELFRLRPPVGRLTEFYLLMSAGGVLGGVFNALLAPVIFQDVWEYPLALIAACAVRANSHEDVRGSRVGDVLLPLALVALILLARRMTGRLDELGHVPILMVVFGFIVPGLALMNFSSRRWRFALGVAGCLIALAATGSGDTIATARSFFGVYHVRIMSAGNSRFMVLMHGTTLHGVKSLTLGEEKVPLSYYSHAGPFGQFFARLPASSVHHVAVVGLGTGELSCYARPGQVWVFYEIDPLVERIARDRRYFNFLANCGNRPRVVLGDARLRLAGAPDHSYDLVILDAFSSDSIPMHLVTREALALYLRKLAPGGRLLFHISSRTLDLRPVVGSLAADAGLTAHLMIYSPSPDAVLWRDMATQLVALAPRSVDLKFLKPSDGWVDLPSGDARSLWTDQRSDILRVVRY